MHASSSRVLLLLHARVPAHTYTRPCWRCCCAAQVVPSIILSVFSAGAGIGQLLLTGTADLLEPAVSGVLALTETSKDKVRPAADARHSS